MRNRFGAALIEVVGCILLIAPARMPARQLSSGQMQSAVKDAVARFAGMFSSNVISHIHQHVSGITGPVKLENVVYQEGLRLDSQIAQSLAETGCAVHNRSHAGAPFADILHLPPGPYSKSYATDSGTRFLLIVGDDCDYIGNPAASSIRMISAHRMDTGLIYVSLFNAQGDVLALLRQTGPVQYLRLDLIRERTPDIETIYADLKYETESWNTALKRLLDKQNAGEGKQ